MTTFGDYDFWTFEGKLLCHAYSHCYLLLISVLHNGRFLLIRHQWSLQDIIKWTFGCRSSFFLVEFHHLSWIIIFWRYFYTLFSKVIQQILAWFLLFHTWIGVAISIVLPHKLMLALEGWWGNKIHSRKLFIMITAMPRVRMGLLMSILNSNFGCIPFVRIRYIMLWIHSLPQIFIYALIVLDLSISGDIIQDRLSLVMSDASTIVSTLITYAFSALICLSWWMMGLKILFATIITGSGSWNLMAATMERWSQFALMGRFWGMG